MTICLAVSDGTKTFIASDTQSINGNYMVPVPKWLVGDTISVAVSGDYLSFNLLSDHWDELESVVGKNGFDAGVFRGYMLGLYDKYDYKPTEAKGSRGWGSEFLLAFAGGIIEFDETLCSVDKQPGEPGFIGSGMPYAVGAFYAAKGSLKSRLHTALRVTNEICSDCSGEYLHVLRA